MGRKPNVIVFFTDQQHWDTLGLNGNPMGLTPNLDRLARQGMFLKHAVTISVGRRRVEYPKGE